MKKIFINFRLIAVCLAALLGACGPSEEGIQAHHAWVLPTAQGLNASVYFKLYNHTSEGDLLTGVTSAAAEAVELEQTTINGNVVQITPLEHVVLPASTEVSFQSGGLQVLLRDLKQDLNLRDEIEIILHFLHYPDLTVKVQVQYFPELESEEHH